MLAERPGTGSAARSAPVQDRHPECDQCGIVALRLARLHVARERRRRRRPATRCPALSSDPAQLDKLCRVALCAELEALRCFIQYAAATGHLGTEI